MELRGGSCVATELYSSLMSEDWVSVVNDASDNTLWQLGTPFGSTGPITGADGSANAWTTNIGDYGTNSDISLFSYEPSP